MKYANVAFSIVPRIGGGDAKSRNGVRVRYGLLFWHTFGTICCFFPLGFIFMHDLLKVIVL